MNFANRYFTMQTPAYIIDESLLENNLKTLRGVIDRTGCKILLAQKAYSLFDTYPLIGQYLDGAACSGLYEARLGFEAMGKENHVFSPAFKEEDFDEILSYSDHVVFNSNAQLERFGRRAAAKGARVGLRINPLCSTQEGHAQYDPCAPGSRLGVTREQFNPACLNIISGLHFHTLCQQNSDALKTTLNAVEEQFGDFLYQLDWINFGGGHHITRQDYDIPLLEECICHIKDKYQLAVYLEPGEAVALNAGFFATSVLDIVHNGMDIAILDGSAACHAPDVLEMPYRAPLTDSGLPGEKPYTYRLGGPTCLAGDVFGDYSFDRPLEIGDILVFQDMAIYSMVKNNTFNGMPLPTIYLQKSDGSIQTLRQFNYGDFKFRLGTEKIK